MRIRAFANCRLPPAVTRRNSAAEQQLTAISRDAQVRHGTARYSSFQLLQGEATALECLLPQEKGPLRGSGDITVDGKLLRRRPGPCLIANYNGTLSLNL
jgi:hypothetical protein